MPPRRQQPGFSSRARRNTYCKNRTCASSEPSRRTLSPRHPRSMLVVAAAPRLVRRHARCNLNAAAGPRSPAASMAAFAAALQAGAPERKLGAAVADKRLSASARVHPRPRQTRRRCRACLCTAALPRWSTRMRAPPLPSPGKTPPELCCSSRPVPPPVPSPAWLLTPLLAAPSHLMHSRVSCGTALPPVPWLTSSAAQPTATQPAARELPCRLPE